MKPREAIILAGGIGTRLKSVVKDIPKPMAPIGEMPFLEYLLIYLQSYRIKHVILSVGYKWELIYEYFGNEFRSMKITYAVEEEPLGTGGGIRLAMNYLEGVHTFVLNGDTFFQVNLDDLSEFNLAHKADISIAVKRMHNFSRYGSVELDVCKVTGFREKRPLRSGVINGGVYATSKYLFDHFDFPEKFSFEEDLLTAQLKNLKVCAMNSSGYFIDIGIPSDYELAIEQLPALVTT